MGKLLTKAEWYVNRLKCMSLPELAYRTRKRVATVVQSAIPPTSGEVPRPVYANIGMSWLKKVEVSDASVYIDAADEMISGMYQVFSLEKTNIGAVIGWNRDPLTRKLAPLTFGKTLNYRDEDLVGDIKYLWEPNRHLHLTILALAWSISENQTYLQEIRNQIDSWIDQCPYLMGPNWSSSLESAIRLINWGAIWCLTGGANSALFEGSKGRVFHERWMRSVYQHSLFIESNFSRYSSANNHLIGEAAGLFVGSVTWPLWDSSKRWRNIAQSILLEEMLTQNASDGVNKEQAISYQQFVLDFFLIAVLAGRANGVEFPEDYWRRMECMLDYIASVMDVDGNVPMIGDADDGYVVTLSREIGFCPYRSLLASGSVLFSRADFRFKAKYFDDKSLLLLGREAEKEFHDLTPNPDGASLPVRRVFPEGGYYILGSNFESDSEIRLIVDAGPLGYQSIAAHGHADALAFTLSISGKEFLVDPGTYTYHTKKKWRNYFRGTAAHNTVVIDKQNQSVIAGNFMWSRKANAECREWKMNDEFDSFVGYHDGYSHLSDPVIHQREICFYKKSGCVLVTDQLRCAGRHTAERYWHFSEKCQVTVQGNEITAINDRVALVVTIPDHGVEITTHIAREEPPLGWISRRFDEKIPTTTIVASSMIHGDSVLKTELRWEQP